MFQSRSGFSARRDTLAVDGGTLGEAFQSRSGFSARRDYAPTRRRESQSVCFNPVLGFLLVATAMMITNDALKEGFNPVVGFLLVATEAARMKDGSQYRFNPVLGFLLVATRLPPTSGFHGVAFQSRSGFSARRDRGVCPLYGFPPLFQSRSGFSARRDVAARLSRRRSCEFQSRSGFSARRDLIRAGRSPRSAPGFNPVLGFLLVATKRLAEEVAG